MVFDIEHVRRDAATSSSGVIVYWLAGAGFVFKFSSGELLCIDPYLSDAVERLHGGFRRISLAPANSKQLVFDMLLLTHDHPDHLDIDSFDGMIKTNPTALILAPQPCVEFLNDHYATFQLISPGDITTIGNVTVKAVPADHGDLCPGAIGFLLCFAGRTLYFTGDTAYNQTMMTEIIQAKPDILIPCINGAYGNLSEHEAAGLARQTQAKIVIPSHFGLFAEHGGCPRRFREELEKQAPNARLVMLTPGRGIEI